MAGRLGRSQRYPASIRRVQINQYVRPTSDVAAGSWTTAPLWSSIDEVAFDDADSISSETLGIAGTTSVAKIGLDSNGSDPLSSTDHVLRVRAKATFTLGTAASLTAELRQGSTLIATLSTALTSSYAVYEYLLSAAEADAITDYAGLALWLSGTFGVGNLGGVQVSWFEFQTPPARVAEHDRLLTDNLVLADSISRALVTARTLADSLAIPDALARGLAQSRSLTDNLVLSDSVARAGAQSRSLTDNLVLSDSLAMTFTRARALAETLVLADSIARALVTDRTLTDSLVLSDALARGLAQSRALSDSLVLADSLARAAFTPSRALADALVLSDSLTRGLAQSRTLADSLVLSDALVGSAFTVARSLTDVLALPDAITRSLVVARSLTDALVLSDSIVGAFTRVRALTDSLVLADSIARGALVRPRAITDALVLTDAITRGPVARARTLTDSLVMSDSIAVAALVVVMPVLPTPAQLLDLLIVFRRQESIRLEVLDLAGQHLAWLATTVEGAGTITNDTQRSILRSLDGLVIPPRPRNANGSERWFAEEIDPIKQRLKIRPWWVLGDTTDPAYAFSLGVFRFADGSRRPHTWGAPMPAVLVDEMLVLTRPLAVSVSYGTGYSVYTAILEQLAAAGITNYRVDATAATISAPLLALLGQDTRASVLNSLCQVAGFLAPYFDNNGVFTARSAPNLATLGAASLNYGVGNRIIEGTINDWNDLLKAPNLYLAVDSSSTQSTVVGRFSVPDSAPFSEAEIGYTNPIKVNIPGLPDQATADAAAQSAYVQASGTYRWVTFDSPPDPRHDTFDVLGYDFDFLIELAWRLPLTVGAHHSHSTRGIYEDA